MKAMKASVGLFCIMALGLSGQAKAVDAEDVLILSSITNIGSGTGGLAVAADQVTLRERRGVDYALGRLTVQLTAGVPASCLDIALAAAPDHRMVVRVRENAFVPAGTSIREKLVVPAADVKACGWAK